MIRKYVYGTPYPTGTCVIDVPVSNDKPEELEVCCGESGLVFTRMLDRDDIIFGLGENVRGINKRGFVYRSWNSDNEKETEGMTSLYSSHNFLVFSGKNGCFGVFFDDPSDFVFDLGYTDPDKAAMTSRFGDLEVYIITGDGPSDVVKEFRKLIGRSYIPPKWAFGYIQSRFGDVSEDSINEALDEYGRLGMPVDSFCIDIDGLDEFQNFTWHRENFKNPEKFVKEKLEQGIHLIPIVDVAIRKDENPYYTSGKAADAFCKGPCGEEFIGYVWPGRCVFPDYFKKSAREWFGHNYQEYLRMGVHGFWNDMNEPSVFASEHGFKRVAELADRTDKNYSFFGFGELKNISALLYDEERDTENFCHEIDGKLVENKRVHNLYGAYMARAADAGFKEYNPDMRFLLFSRSSCIGSHRYTGVWLGDNQAWWSCLLLNLKMLPSMNMCGYLFTGADIGGFNENTTDELMLRWLQLGVFTPLMRNHSAWGTRKQELFRFKYRDAMVKTVRIRYALIPYIYSEFVKAAMRNECMFRPLAFDYPSDGRAMRIEDQLMLGGECMIAPVYEPNARGRYVYLPEDMLMVRMRDSDDYDLVRMPAGDHWIELKTEELAFFIRKNCAIPFAKSAERVDRIDYSSLEMIGWCEAPYSYELYNDDGLTNNVGENFVTKLEYTDK